MKIDRVKRNLAGELDSEHDHAGDQKKMMSYPVLARRLGKSI